MARVVGDAGLFAAVMIAIFVFLVFGVLLGMFWGGPVSQPHGAQGHGHGHNAPPATKAVDVSARPVAPAAPVASVSALEAAAKPIVLEDFASAPETTPLVAPDYVASGVETAKPPVAQVLPAKPEPTPVKPEPALIAVGPAPVVAELPTVAPAPERAKSTVAGAEGGHKPAGLTAARGGVPDKLTTIEGIGPVLEKLCHDMGIYHFDQIAGWDAPEIAWMDGNLKGFRGRVTRDKWVRQAALIGEVGVEEFLRRAKLNEY
jgi:predicted flap endonuclease-1-like 5' DNA nuclease